MSSGAAGSAALLARSAVTSARVASVHAVDGFGQPGPSTTARVDSATSGGLVFRLERASAVARHFQSTPDAAVALVAPAPFAVVRLTGFVRLTEPDHTAHGRYELTITGIRLVGATRSVEVPLSEYWAIDDEPISAAAPSMLAHLTEAHYDALLGTVRAHIDSMVEIVAPRALNGHGLTVTVVTPTGVRELTLAFPDAPLRSTGEVAAYLRAALSCPCHTRRDLRAHHDDL